MEQNDSPFIKPQEVATRLGVSVTTVYAWCAAGILPHQRKSGQGNRGGIVIHRAEFERWLREGRPSPAAQPQQPQPDPNRQTVAIQADGLTIELTITIKPDQRSKVRPLVSIR